MQRGGHVENFADLSQQLPVSGTGVAATHAVAVRTDGRKVVCPEQDEMMVLDADSRSRTSACAASQREQVPPKLSTDVLSRRVRRQEFFVSGTKCLRLGTLPSSCKREARARTGQALMQNSRSCRHEKRARLRVDRRQGIALLCVRGQRRWATAHGRLRNLHWAVEMETSLLRRSRRLAESRSGREGQRA